MSEKNEVQSTAKNKAVNTGEELVDYIAPLLPGQDNQDQLAGVNGEFIRIKRGELVKIKAKFVEVLNNAAKQQTEAYKASVAAQKTQKLYDM